MRQSIFHIGRIVDDVVERSKTPDLGSGPIQGVGSNPTVINTFLAFFSSHMENKLWEILLTRKINSGKFV